MTEHTIHGYWCSQCKKLVLMKMGDCSAYGHRCLTECQPWVTTHCLYRLASLLNRHQCKQYRKDGFRIFQPSNKRTGKAAVFLSSVHGTGESRRIQPFYSMEGFPKETLPVAQGCPPVVRKEEPCKHRMLPPTQKEIISSDRIVFSNSVSG